MTEQALTVMTLTSMTNMENIGFVIHGSLVWFLDKVKFLWDIEFMIICLLSLILKSCWIISNQLITCLEIGNYRLVIQDNKLGGPTTEIHVQPKQMMKSA